MAYLRLFAVLAAMLLSLGAHAHAFLDHADPRVGSTVSASPAEIRLWFTQELEPAFSRMEVTDASGNRVGDAAQVDRQDRTQMHLTLPNLAPGLYTVLWRVLSVDTHVSEGKFTFRVAP
jgi:hypothetical protein